MGVGVLFGKWPQEALVGNGESEIGTGLIKDHNRKQGTALLGTSGTVSDKGT